MVGIGGGGGATPGRSRPPPGNEAMGGKNGWMGVIPGRSSGWPVAATAPDDEVSADMAAGALGTRYRGRRLRTSSWRLVSEGGRIEGKNRGKEERKKCLGIRKRQKESAHKR